MIVTDVVMPEMSGSALAARVHELRPDVPILYMSGYPRDVVSHQRIVAPDVQLLEKPFTRDALLRAVAEVLATASVSAGATRSPS